MRKLRTHCVSCASMGCATTHCMISSAQSPSQNSYLCIQRLVGILQRKQQTEDLCFHSSLHSHWFLFSRSSRLPRPLHFFDEKLFKKILTCPNHILRTLLPPPTAQNESLRNRPHNRQLPDRISRITDCKICIDFYIF